MIYKSASLAHDSLNAQHDRVTGAPSVGFGHCCRTGKPLVGTFEAFFDVPNRLSFRPVLVCGSVDPYLPVCPRIGRSKDAMRTCIARFFRSL